MFSFVVIPLFFTLVGISTSLYVQTPYGHIGMFDLVSYIVGPLMFIKNIRWFNFKEKWLLSLITLWVVGSYIANMYHNYVEYEEAIKALGVSASIWCMVVVWLVILYHVPKAVKWVIVGYAIGGVISLYAFQNGALLGFASAAGYSGQGYLGDFLLDKQVLPNWHRMYALGGGALILILWPTAPMTIFAAGFASAAFAGLIEGASRGAFGLNALAALIAVGIGYANRITKIVLRNIVLLSTCVVAFSKVLLVGYAHYAQSGKLGEGELTKYEIQFGEGQQLTDNIMERGGFRDTWDDFKSKPLGHGGSRAMRHSAVSDAVYKEGLFAIPFWCYFTIVLLRFLNKYVVRFQRWAPFVSYVFFNVIWQTLSSPFAGRSIYCLVAALALLAERAEFWDIWEAKEVTHVGR